MNDPSEEKSTIVTGLILAFMFDVIGTIVLLAVGAPPILAVLIPIVPAHIVAWMFGATY